MGNIVDFNKGKKNVEQKKAQAEQRKRKNKRLAEKARRYDQRSGFKAIHFYAFLIIAIAIFVIVRAMF